MHRSWMSLFAPVVTGIVAFFVAFTTHGAPPAWMPSLAFAAGTSVVLISFVEIFRTGAAWLAHAASIGWVAGGLVAAGGLFSAGAALMLNARSIEFDPIPLIGVFVALGGALWQRRARPARRGAV